MAGLKELKKRLSTVQQTEVMTSAMKMVSASKLRKAQGSLYKAKAFAQSISDVYRKAGGVVAPASANGSGAGNGARSADAANSTKAKKALIIVLTSNKGLCGSFNAAVCKETEALIREKYTGAGKSFELLCIGVKGYEYFKIRNYPLCKEADSRAELKTYGEVAKVSQIISKWYDSGKYDKVEVVYSHPLNAMSVERRNVSLLPLEEVDFSAGRKGTDKNTLLGTELPNIDNVLFFPSRQEVAKTIVPLLAAALLYFFITESAVAEHGARMTAMSQATDNAQTLGRELNLTYNKLRQQAITGELLEIIAGANAL
ncbi:MAG: ATP synthase F1 subunit gamma [Bacteroidales bacterium]|jgi:F-type H+-transporting ATPase subunit gamma|nr:ATP synthase F1 subunit gamma [Bacteroidales bacterium]